MSTLKSETFNQEVWNSYALELAEAQAQALEQFKEVLQHIDLQIVRTLMQGTDNSWTAEEMAELEAKILGHLSLQVRYSEEQSTEDDGSSQLVRRLSVLMDCLAKVVDLINRQSGKEAPRPRRIRRTRLEKNPFCENVPEAERTMKELEEIVLIGHANEPSDAEGQIALGVLTSIYRFTLLDTNQQVAWLEALGGRETNTIPFADGIYGILIRVAFQDQQKAERRLYILDRRNARLIQRIHQPEVQNILNGLQERGPESESHVKAVQRQRRNYKALSQYLQKIVNRFVSEFPFQDPPLTLDDATRAAHTMAYLKLPAAVAAHRRRTTISHSPRIEVLRRIYTGAPVTLNDSAGRDSGKNDAIYRLADAEVHDSSSAEVHDSSSAEVHDSSSIEPRWYVRIRAAFLLKGTKSIDAELARIAGTTGTMGKCMAEFTQYLLAKREVSTAERYGLLISRRLGCRQETDEEFDPMVLSVPELESLYEEILDDDREDGAAEEDELVGYDKRPIVEAISSFHRFLREKHGVGELVELKDRLHPNGLLPVDANFITIDEYERVLESVDADRSLNDPYLRNAVKLFIAICFWCGLRREEAIGLRLMDLDCAGHLHILPYRNHHLKTGNAARSVPVAALMQDEFSVLLEWTEQRKKTHHTGDITLIFSQISDSSKPIPSELIYSVSLKHIRGALKDESLKIHHLRHSFATLLAIRLLPGMERLASKVFKSHPKMLNSLKVGERRKLRHNLFLTDQISRDDIAGIAFLLGHGTPSMSVEHYIHCLDWCRVIGDG